MIKPQVIIPMEDYTTLLFKATLAQKGGWVEVEQVVQPNGETELYLVGNNHRELAGVINQQTTKLMGGMWNLAVFDKSKYDHSNNT